MSAVVPTLGWSVLAWMAWHLPNPRDETQPYRPVEWQARRTLRWYELDASGKRLWNRVHDEDPKGKGKALDLDCPVPTPTGWTTMGAIVVGDVVLDDLGHPTRVVAVSEVISDRECYAVTFDDGEVIVSDAAHLWETDARRAPFRATRTTAEIAATLRNPNGRYQSANHSVRLAGPLHLEDADLPVEPYTLGVWLGDGDSDSARITMGDQDAAALTRELTAVGTAVGVRKRTNAAGRYTIGSERPGHGLRAALRRSGLLGHKHVPSIYLRASYPQRLALLQGLMDTDGYIDGASGQCELSLSSEALARGAHELVLTLGIKATVREDRMTLRGVDVGPRWRLRFHPPVARPVFRLSRKLERQRVRHARRALSGERRIVSCARVRSRPVRCITVSAGSQMFLAGRSMVPTHNSPHAGATAICEFRGPVVFSGWARKGQVYACEDHGCGCGWEYRYRPGEARGRPWGSPGMPSPWIQVAAVSEAQTANTWAALHAFLAANKGRLGDWLRLDPGRTLVYWRDRMDAKIERVSSSAASRTGQPITHAVMDEPQEWTPELGGPVLSNTILENLTKLDGWAHYTGNAPVLGRGSVAEMLGGPAPRALHLGPRPSVDPREDMTRDELRPLVEEVYEGTPWTPVDRILDDMEDRAAHPWSSSYRLFLNSPWKGGQEGRWMNAQLWASRSGDVVFSKALPVFAAVRIAHEHRLAAVAWAQRQPTGEVMVRCRLFEADAADIGEYVAAADLEDCVLSLRRRYPGRVMTPVRFSKGGKEHLRPVPGPEIAYHGAFFEGTAQRLKAAGAAVADVPDSPQRRAAAAEQLMDLVINERLVHDGDEVLAQHLANVVGIAVPKGWQIGPASERRPIVAALAVMTAVAQVMTAQPTPSRKLSRGRPR